MRNSSWFHYLLVVLVVSWAGVAGCSGTLSSQQEAATESTIAQSTPNLSSAALQVTSYRSPTCGCCGNWVEHMREAGFQVDDQVTEDMEAVKQELGVPTELASCHTAVVNGYVIEGHIPAKDVQLLLAEQPDVEGIAVPGMPIGSPGMESGNIVQPYTVYTFTEVGEAGVFQEHGS
jgi:hypothetical protein